MTRTSPPQVAFSAGELDPLLHRRFDYVKYQTGLAKCAGFLPLAQGGFTRMPGSWWKGDTRNDLSGRLIPFTFAVNDSVVLEFTNLRMRVWRYGNLVMDGASPFELVTPYDLAAVKRLNFAQSADVIRMVDGQLPMQRLSRLALDNWTITAESFSLGPFRAQNLNKSRTIFVSGDSGDILLDADFDFFRDAHVGSLLELRPTDNSDVPLWTSNETGIIVGEFRRYQGQTYKLTEKGGADTGPNPPVHREGYSRVDNAPTVWQHWSSDVGIVRITEAFTSTSNTALGTVIQRIPRGCLGLSNGTYRWSEGAWSDKYGYPAAIEIFDQRLVAASTPSDPRTVWFSGIGDFRNFGLGAAADDAFAYSIGGDSTVNTILQLKRGKTGLHILALGEEYSTRSDSRGQVIGPTTAVFGQNSSEGASGARPIAVDGNPVFISRDGRRVIEIAYSFQDDANLSRNLAKQAQHLGNSAFLEIAWQNSPMKIAWLRRANGQLAAMVYDKAEEVLGWATLPMAGGFVESIAVTPDATGTRDVVTMIVRRTVDGDTKRFVEELADNFTVLTGEDPAKDANHLFCARIAWLNNISPGDGAGVGINLSNLAGATVHAWADTGIYGPLQVASNGDLDLPAPVDQVIIGLFDASHVARTLDITASAPDGSSMGRQKRLHSGTGVGLHRSVAGTLTAIELEIGKPNRAAAPVPLLPRQAGDAETAAYSGIVSAPAPTGHSKELALEFRPVGGAPLTITAVVPPVQEAGR